MKFEEIIPALKAGKKVRRKDWNKKNYITIGKDDLIIDENNYAIPFALNDFEKDNWEIVKSGPKKVKLRDLTKKQYKYFCRRFNDPNDLYGNNGDYFDGTACNTCPCTNVICGLTLDNCRFYHKDLYSDKFLDQEVETYDDDDLPREIEDYH